ncbi:glutamate--cysteine ligase [Streptomyces sp. NPDC047002]|uniref:glutamate--cysteine ligase n=1 Tax=Streptomyces sp. NPDC047002 TaxID=3155475 RepID=UPI003454D03E
MRSVGVEEELLLVDAESGEPRALSTAVLAAAEGEEPDDDGSDDVFERELHGQQVEFATRPHTDMDRLGAELVRWRRAADTHARRFGARAAALATSPLPVSPVVNDGGRYRWLSEKFGLTTREQLTCGCHVHVAVEDDEEGVAVLDRMRPWLPVLLALSANSPFWQGKDTEYGSYRSRVWLRWPSAGPTETFGSPDAYHRTVAAMVESGVLRDEGMLYFDARLSHRYPTVEIRVADVCLSASTTTTLAALARALVETEARARRSRGPAPDHGVALLRLASWQAARSGLEGPLLHPRTMRPAPARTVVEALFDHVRDALADPGDTDLVRGGLDRLLDGETGAARQRAVLRRTDSLREVAAECAALTVAGSA